jgi:hypothetical protein
VWVSVVCRNAQPVDQALLVRMGGEPAHDMNLSPHR